MFNTSIADNPGIDIYPDLLSLISNDLRLLVNRSKIF